MTRKKRSGDRAPTLPSCLPKSRAFFEALLRQADPDRTYRSRRLALGAMCMLYLRGLLTNGAEEQREMPRAVCDRVVDAEKAVQQRATVGAAATAICSR